MPDVGTGTATGVDMTTKRKAKKVSTIQINIDSFCPVYLEPVDNRDDTRAAYDYQKQIIGLVERADDGTWSARLVREEGLARSYLVTEVGLHFAVEKLYAAARRNQRDAGRRGVPIRSMDWLRKQVFGD